MNPEAPTVFESFNARSLGPEQVAQTFVAPSFFAKLVARCHSTLIGPRGSGKTSLLKMLQPYALESWQSEEARAFRSAIDFTGVFIQTDISWNRQTIALVDGLPESAMRGFRTAAFTTQVLHSLIETLCWRVGKPKDPNTTEFKRAKVSMADEQRVVVALSSTWGLSPATDTFTGLKHALAGRIVEIWQAAQNAAITPNVAITYPSWVGLDFLSCANQAVEMFDDVAGETGAKWALLFDELELAPQWIMDGLVTALRSTHSRFLFKLALSPFDEGFKRSVDALSAAPLQDYNEVLLWNAKKETGLEFSRKLFLRVFEDQHFDVSTFEEVVGHSAVDNEEEKQADYAKGGRRYKVLLKAISADPSFAKYWSDSEIDIHNMDKLSEAVRAAKIRKIYPLVYLRTQFRADAESKRAIRQVRSSRKSIKMYHGSSDFLDISEGNPRWIVGIAKMLIDEARSSSFPLKSFQQASIIEGTIHRFRARMKTISVGPSRIQGKLANLLSLVDAIGDFLGEAFVEKDFKSQPYLCFTVDSHISNELANGIGRAVNAGAIVYVPDKDSHALLHNVRGKKFRLSYLLAPYFRLPLRLGESISLTRILTNGVEVADIDELPFLLR